MIRFKPIFALALGLFLALSLSACGLLDLFDNSSGPAAGSSQANAGPVREGLAAPDFDFVTIDGKTGSLSDYRGKVVLLNFWATWCGYCIDEMPDMQKIREEYPEVVVLAVVRSDDSVRAKNFALDKGYDFVWALDDDASIAGIYPSNGIPYSIIIDREGTIGTIYEGSAPNMFLYFQKAILDAGA